MQFAKMLGASVAGSCRITAIEGALELGIDPVVDFTHFELGPIMGRFDVVFDTPSLLSFREGSARLKRGGIVLGTEPTRSYTGPWLLSLIESGVGCRRSRATSFPSRK